MTLAFDPPPTVDSPVARLDPRWRLAALVTAIAAVAFLRTLPTAGAALLGSAGLVAAARLPPKWVLRRIAAVAAGLLPLLVVIPLSPALGPGRVGLVTVKAGASVLLALTLLGTAPLPVTLHAAQALRFPTVLVQIILLTHRYVFVLADELSRLRRALRLRGFRFRMTMHGYRTAGHVVGTLLVRGTERAEGVAAAMRCRGFDGAFRSLASFRTTAADVAFFFAVVSAGIALVVWDWRAAP